MSQQSPPQPSSSEPSHLAEKLESLNVSQTMLGIRLLDSSPDCVELLDLDGRIVFVNDHGLRLFERDHFDEIKGKIWRDLWPASMQERIDKAIADAISGANVRFSGLCPTRSGQPKWWDVAINPIHDASGSIKGLMSVSRDISSQKFAEKALRISEERFRALADNIAQFAWMADANGYIFWYNQRWFDYTGTTFDEMAGWGWQNVHDPGHIERVVEKFKACLAAGTEWEDTFPLRAADGSYRWFLSRARPIHDDEGNVTLWCGTNTDISDQRNASHRLRQLARLIELSHEAILVRSPQQGILLWNRGCEDLYGYPQSEALGKDSNALLETDRAVSAEEIEALLEDEGTWSGELERVAKDGHRVWVDCRKQVMKIGDQLVVLETARDITERRKADEVQQLLVGELNHRVKNTLAIVQSLATQTARTAPSLSTFMTSFKGRLQSLSSAHSVLTDRHWAGARIHDLVQAQIDVIAGDGQRVSISGPDLFVPPQAALQVTLILHELGTNAVKYGALSNATGQISITWTITESQSPKLSLIWREHGGPPVKEPENRGFGLSLIERSGALPHLNAELRLEPDGVVCRIIADLFETETNQDAYFNPGRRGNSTTV
jgi:PAS domain S-box-containing protein